LLISPFELDLSLRPSPFVEAVACIQNYFLSAPHL
jgi:hypothetical protein